MEKFSFINYEQNKSFEILKVFKKEKKLKSIFALIYFIFFIGILILIFLSAFNLISNFITQQNLGIIILLSVSCLFFLFKTINELIEKSFWNKTITQIEDKELANEKINHLLFISIKKITLKQVNYFWFLILFLTYFGVFNLAIWFLYNRKSWSYGIDKDANIFTFIAFNFEWEKWLIKAFKNVNLMLIINLSIIISLIIVYVSYVLINKKRIFFLNEFIKKNYLQIQKELSKIISQRRKNWIKTYFILITLTILLPMAFIIYFIYRMIRPKQKNNLF